MMGSSRLSHRWIVLASLAAMLLGMAHQACAENPEIASRRAAERTEFSNDEIKDGFFKIAFHPELQLGSPVERVRKFDEPVRIFLLNKAWPDRRGEIAAVIADIGARVNHLDVAVTTDRKSANMVVSLVASDNFGRTLRSRYGSRTAAHIEKSLDPQCLSGIGKDSQFRIRRAEVILPIDAGDFTLRDCAYEEVLQALGAINDDRSVPWTMFNDDVQMGFFDVYDQYLINLLYDPRIRPGMTRQEAEAVLPDVLSSARAWVTTANIQHPAVAKHRRAAEQAIRAVAVDGSRLLR